MKLEQLELQRCPVCYVNKSFNTKNQGSGQYFKTYEFEVCSSHLNLIKSLEHDAQRIYYYFVCSGMNKLPEELHNFMLMDASDGNAFAKSYLNFLQRPVGKVK